MKISRALILSIIFALSFSTNTVFSGGLFGDGGLIRGSIGNAIDKHVEKPILTPIAKAGPKVVAILTQPPDKDLPAEPPKTEPGPSCTKQPGKPLPPNCL